MLFLGGIMWSQVSTTLTSLMLTYVMVQQYFPRELRPYLKRFSNKIMSFISPYIHIAFPEYTGDSFKRSKLYENIQTYLSDKSTTRARRLKAHDIKNSKSLILGLDDNSEITDEFQGVKLWWTSRKTDSSNSSFRFWSYPNSDEKRQYKLTFHRRHRELITTAYLSHVVNEGKALKLKNRQRNLYTNSSRENYRGDKWTKWIPVEFEHPASFDTLAMDPKEKQDIINDLLKFKEGKEYYAKIGKPWKRGYLLYGPPGTGKSTMIAAMANFLDYDVYDLELTSVMDNTELRKLLIDSSNKSIIVIEDIDCSLDLTGQRQKQKEIDEDEEEKDPVRKKAKKEDKKESKVTLSGLLNFIDGIWSACGGERLIVFTTNYVDKLDPALIRRGRMDKHIELSYCSFEAFKMLARNYLDVESHDLFPTIEKYLGETDMTPADVAENLMPKSDTEDADECLKNLVKALEEAKEEAIKKKAEKEDKMKAEEEAKLKAEEEEKLEKESDEGNSAKNEVNCNGALAEEVKENGSVSSTT